MGKRGDDQVRARQAARLYRRLAARMRLEGLAGAAHQVSVAQRELERLKYYYLPMWSQWCYLHTLTGGLPSEVPFADYMKGSVREFDQTDWRSRIDAEACRLVDQAVVELGESVGLPVRAALAVRYLNAQNAAVYRSGRLVDLTLEQVDDICDYAERELVSIVRRKGLLV